MVSNFPTGLNWNVKGTADFNVLLNDIKNTEKATEAPAEQVVPNKAAMFAQINQGMNVTSSELKKNFLVLITIFFVKKL